MTDNLLTTHFADAGGHEQSPEALDDGKESHGSLFLNSASTCVRVVALWSRR